MCAKYAALQSDTLPGGGGEGGGGTDSPAPTNHARSPSEEVREASESSETVRVTERKTVCVCVGGGG
jgi:hypothetical protein